MAACSLSGTRLRRRIKASIFSQPFHKNKQRYHYTPLATNQIRLLKLHPGPPDTRLECTLKVVDLLAYDDRHGECSNDEDWRHFHAISYAWGKSDWSIEITCNDSIAYVSQNLADALRRFRNPKIDIILWVDALCINQKDHNERAAQVKLMGLIYFKARRIEIWLGREDEIDDPHRAEVAVNLIKNYAKLYKSYIDPTGKKLWDLSGTIFRSPNVAKHPQWEALRRLYQRPWFTRVWVVQELGLARDATFYCGNSFFTQNELMNFQDVMMSSEPGAIIYSSVNTRTTYLGSAYKRSTRGSTREELGENPQTAETFFDILLASHGLQCTDPRDRIYAFLGHPSAFKRQLLDVGPYTWYPNNYYEEASTIITPKYGKSYKLSTLCIDLAVAAVRDRGFALNVLACVDHDFETITMRFPSWIPRWNLETPSPPFPGSKWYYDASRGFSNPPFCVQDTGKLRKHPRLVCRAIRLGKVSIAVHLLDGRSPEWITNLMAQLLPDIPRRGDISHIAPPATCSWPYEDDFLFALALTLTAGLTTFPYYKREPAAEHREHHLSIFRAWYRQQEALEMGTNPDPVDNKDADCFKASYKIHHRQRCLLLTFDGRFGLGPWITGSRDEVWLPMGAKMPFIFRPTGTGTYKVIGQTFLYDAMRGEAVQGKCEEDFGVVVLE